MHGTQFKEGEFIWDYNTRNTVYHGWKGILERQLLSGGCSVWKKGPG